MNALLNAIDQWIRNLLTSFIHYNLSTLFTDVNTKVSTIATEVAHTPASWNGSIFSMIRTLSNNIIVPIAGIIISYILCYELITLITEKNNMHDVDTFIFFKYLFKAAIAVYLVSNTFTITMAVFDVAHYVVSNSEILINKNTNIDISSALATLDITLQSMDIGGLLQLTIETALISICLKIMSILITVILYGRMIEIYMSISIAPIPFATMTNREWGSIGTNYFKSLFALGFQGFFIMICVAIYAVLVNSIIISPDIHVALFSCAAYTVLLCFALLKTGSISKTIFGAH